MIRSALLLTLFPLVTLAGPKLVQKAVTIEEQPYEVGEKHEVRIDQEMVASWVGKDGKSSVTRGGKTGYELSVAHVDSAGRVAEVLVRRLNNKGDLEEFQVKRGETPTSKTGMSHYLAKELFRAQSYALLFGLKGTLQPGKEAVLSPKLWEEFRLNGKLEQRVARLLGVEPATGFAVLELSYTITETNVPIRGATTLASWKGRLVFDPRGPRLLRVHLDAETEVLLPPNKKGKATAKGKIRYERRVTGRAKR
jgi:hypothetical protein